MTMIDSFDPEKQSGCANAICTRVHRRNRSESWDRYDSDPGLFLTSIRLAQGFPGL